MTNELIHQLSVLQHIAAFSAGLRGHQLGEWRIEDGQAVVSCVLCGAALRLCFPALQPEMDGAILDQLCVPRATAVRAA
ncbi:MAG TPA: hypothetical protein VMI94_02160 [Bryobacteraceae bacterium]|nr:hypothetical protein [Bryobacteraceae bacterium]